MGKKLTKAQETRIMMTLPLEMRIMGIIMRWKHTVPGASAMVQAEGIIYPEEWTRPALRVMAEALKQRRTYGTSEPLSQDSWLEIEHEALKLAVKDGVGVAQYLEDWWLCFDLASDLHPDNMPGLLEAYIDAAQEAELVDRIEQMREAVHGGDLPSHAVAGLQEEVRARASQRREAMRPPYQTSEAVLREVFDDFSRLVSGEGVEDLPLPSKWDAINRAIGGWYIGVSCIAGRPKHGKSTMAEQEMLDAALRGRRVALVSLEMTAKKTQRRILARMAGVPVGHIESPLVEEEIRDEETGEVWKDKRPRLSPSQMQKLTTAAARLAELSLDFVDVVATSRTWSTVAQRMDRYLDHTGAAPDLLVIDHLHKFIINDPGRLDTAYNAIVEGIDQWAFEHKTRVILLAQLNRKVEGEKRLPMASDIREAGGVEQTMQALVYPWREFVLGRDVETTIAGHLGTCEECLINTFTRNGAGGVANLLWSRDRAVWAERQEGSLPF